MKHSKTTITFLLLISIGYIATWLESIRPWQSKILAHGRSPGGLGYGLMQTFRDLVEPYQVSFYIRDPHGIWRWNYLGHQENEWKSGTVTFSDGSAFIEKGAAQGGFAAGGEVG